MAKHLYTVGAEVFDYLQEAIVAQSRVEHETGVKPRIMEHFEDGSVIPHPHGFEDPTYIVGTAADEADRMADEAWNQ